MGKTNRDILNHLYGLLLELNFHRPDEDVFSDRTYSEDPFIAKHLKQIKLRTSKYKALLLQKTYSAVLAEFHRLKEIGFEEIKKLLKPQEAQQLQPLFSKFEQLSEKDEESIAEDQEFLQLISALKDKLNKENADD